jgi:hypothetical protein
MVDSELRQVDAMLSDLNRPRLAARSVAGVDAPARLTAYIEADGWDPVDAQVHVLDVARLVRQLGGEELYGNDMTVPLRELMQNGADAVRARRICEGLDDTYGTLIVRLGTSEEEDWWVEVEDDGLGMSLEVMQRFLLNFGTSYWTSPSLPYDFPKLTRAGFVPTGRFGIGFFSVFMWGEHVKVTTRRFDYGHADTRVLEFGAGVGQRPIVRSATETEHLRGGGTRVRVWLGAAKLHRLLGQPNARDDEHGDPPKKFTTLVDGCRRVAPALDVNVDVEAPDGRSRASAANDWLTLDFDEVATRIGGRWDSFDASVLDPDFISDDAGRMIGRAALAEYGEGVAVVGGLRSTSISHMVGVLVASPVRAARDLSLPVASQSALASWATAQARRALAADLPERTLLEFAETVRALGGNLQGLPVATHQDGTFTLDDVLRFIRSRGAFRLVQDAELSGSLREGESAILKSDVVIVAMTSTTMIQYRHGSELVNWPVGVFYSRNDRTPTLMGAIIEAAATSWACEVDDVVVAPPGRHFDDEIGTRDGKPLTAYAYKVLRPGTRAAHEHERIEKARELIGKHGMQTTAQLSAALDVTPATVRRLLKPCIEREILTKTQGGYAQP